MIRRNESTKQTNGDGDSFEPSGMGEIQQARDIMDMNNPPLVRLGNGEYIRDLHPSPAKHSSRECGELTAGVKNLTSSRRRKEERAVNAFNREIGRLRSVPLREAKAMAALAGVLCGAVGLLLGLFLAGH